MAARKTTPRKAVRKRRPKAKKKATPGVSKRPSIGGQPGIEFDAEFLFRLVRRGNTIDGCADILSVGRSTLHRHIADDPSLKAAVDQARGERNDRLLTAMFTGAMRGSAPLLIFLSKNYCGLREIRAVELSGPNGGALEVNMDLAPIVEEKLDEFLRTRTNGDAA